MEVNIETTKEIQLSRENYLNRGDIEYVELRVKSKDLEEGKKQEIHFQGTDEGEAIEKREVTG